MRPVILSQWRQRRMEVIYGMSCFSTPIPGFLDWKLVRIFNPKILGLGLKNSSIPVSHSWRRRCHHNITLFNVLSPVYTSDNVAKNDDIVAETDDIVAKNGNNIEATARLQLCRHATPTRRLASVDAVEQQSASCDLFHCVILYARRRRERTWMQMMN